MNNERAANNRPISYERSGIMIRGTSQEFRFKLPYAYNTVNELCAIFGQDNYQGPTQYRPLPIVKIKDQGRRVDAYHWSVTLNSEETLRFSNKRKAKVRLIGKTKSGASFATKESLINVYGDNSILDGDILLTPTDQGLVILDGQPIIQGG